MSKNELFFVAYPRQQRLRHNNQLVINGKVVCGMLHAGDDIVVFSEHGWSEAALCYGIIKQNKKVTTAWAGEEVSLVLPFFDEKILFIASTDCYMPISVTLSFNAKLFQSVSLELSQKVKVVFPDYNRYTVEADITAVLKKDDHQWWITVRLPDGLFLKLNQTVEIISDAKRLVGTVAELLV